MFVISNIIYVRIVTFIEISNIDTGGSEIYSIIKWDLYSGKIRLIKSRYVTPNSETASVEAYTDIVIDFMQGLLCFWWILNGLTKSLIDTLSRYLSNLTQQFTVYCTVYSTHKDHDTAYAMKEDNPENRYYTESIKKIKSVIKSEFQYIQLIWSLYWAFSQGRRNDYLVHYAY